jgi:branched-chain amino acid transport system permease protein
MDGIFLQQLVNGLTLGSVYGLIAIGYTMVYGIIGMINFAHGEVYMISAYLAAISLALLAYFGIESFPLLMLGTLCSPSSSPASMAGSSNASPTNLCATPPDWHR